MKFNDREEIIALTPLWKGERLPDGRPKVEEKYLKALKNLTLENGIKSIGVGAFSDCTNLNNVVIPESVEFIGGYAFIRCNRLHYIWCEASQKPSGWDEEWDAKVSSFEFTKVYWAKSWHYVDGVPTLSK